MSEEQNNEWLSDSEIESYMKATQKENKEEETAIGSTESAPVLKEEVEVSRMEFQELTEERDGEKAPLTLLYDIPVEIRVVLASVRMSVSEINALHKGKVIPLNKLAGEAVEVIAGGELIAKGETVVMDDKFGVLIKEIIAPKERLDSIRTEIRKQKQA